MFGNKRRKELNRQINLINTHGISNIDPKKSDFLYRVDILEKIFHEALPVANEVGGFSGEHVIKNYELFLDWKVHATVIYEHYK